MTSADIRKGSQEEVAFGEGLEEKFELLYLFKFRIILF